LFDYKQILAQCAVCVRAQHDPTMSVPCGVGGLQGVGQTREKSRMDDAGFNCRGVQC